MAIKKYKSKKFSKIAKNAKKTNMSKMKRKFNKSGKSSSMKKMINIRGGSGGIPNFAPPPVYVSKLKNIFQKPVVKLQPNNQYLQLKTFQPPKKFDPTKQIVQGW
jgi:hypothetical protein